MGAAVELINGWVSRGVVWPVMAAPFVGSFCGVLIGRWPLGQSVVLGRSACMSCGATLGAAELVPVLSYAVLRGRCRSCKAPIAAFHLWVELAAAGIAVSAAAAGAEGAQLWSSCVLGWTLLTLGWIDTISMRLPDKLTLPLILCGLTEAWLLEPDTLTSRAFAAAIGYTGFSAIRVFHARLRGRQGLGLGDAKLLAAAGAWVGLSALGSVVLIAAVAALLWALRRLRPDPAERIPFGPFLSAATWVVWLHG